MKTLILNICKLLCYLILVCFCLVLIGGMLGFTIKTRNLSFVQGGNGHLFTRLHEVRTNEFSDMDILFCGSSHAYRGFDTRIFERENLRSFNLGSSSQTPIQTLYLLEKNLDKISPSLVVLEVFPDIFCLDGVESSLDVICNDKMDMGMIEMALHTPSVKVFTTLIYNLSFELFHDKDKYVEAKENEVDVYIPGGYVCSKVTYCFSEDDNQERLIIDLRENQIAAFEDIIELLKEKSIDYVLVEAPVTKCYYGSYSNHALFEQKMKNYGSYINYNENTCLIDTVHFYDLHHLNQKGVELFNQQVIKDLKSLRFVN